MDHAVRITTIPTIIRHATAAAVAAAVTIAAAAVVVDGHERRRECNFGEGPGGDGDQAGLIINSIMHGGAAVRTEAVGDAAALVTDPGKGPQASANP